MKLRKILVPTDFSSRSDSALEYAAALARSGQADLLIVHVKERPEIVAETGMAGYPVDVDDAEARRLLADVKPPGGPVGYSQHLLHGYPADEILKLAESEGVDLIVLGTHGRKGLSRLLLGSVAEAVVRRANCPVLSVKQPDHVAALESAVDPAGE